MTVTKFETTIFPQTQQGRRIANGLISRLMAQGALGEISEDTQTITIKAHFTFSISDEDEGDDD